MRNKRSFFVPTIILIATLLPSSIFASTLTDSTVHRMMLLVFQLAMIIFVARYAGKLFEHFNLPAVIGELFSGVIIGPYLLGGLSIPGFPHGLFGEHLITHPLASLPVSSELYAFSVVASILLLFTVGLETDINLFLKFSFPSLIIGGSGVIIPFVVGTAVTAFFLDISFMAPKALFMGVTMTATSVGITARILSGHHKINSPEGVTILGSAVIDDVMGIILLAIVVGLSTAGETALNWQDILRITLKALAVWLGFTLVGLVFAKKLSQYLKTFKNTAVVGIMSFGIALILAGIFESVGLAMIIGAYVTGLALSKTDISYVIQESLHNLYEFFVPIFFCVSGMYLNFRVFNTWHIVIFGLLYTLAAYVTKILGCGLPSFFFKFNRLGATRIGVGMIPRGEVALIIVGLGLSYGILDHDVAGVAILMIFITSALGPVQLNHLFKNKKSGTVKDFEVNKHLLTSYDFPSQDLTELVANHVIKYFRDEGFYINLLESDHHLYHIRQNDTFLSFRYDEAHIVFTSSKDDVSYVKNIMYETLLDLNQMIKELKRLAKPEDIKRNLTIEGGKSRMTFASVLNNNCIIPRLVSSTKLGIIQELVEVLDKNGFLNDKKLTTDAILERENSMSTGMQNGLALPHGKTNGTKKMTLAIGLKKEGVDFGSLDGKPSTVFILVVSPKQSAEPHIQLLSEIGKKLFSEARIKELLELELKTDIYKFFTEETR